MVNPDGGEALILSEVETAVLPDERLRSLPLSRREQEILRWVCQGKTNWEIATILGTSQRTVDTHMEHILKRLGVENRTAARCLVCSLRWQKVGRSGASHQAAATPRKALKHAQD